MQKHAKSWLVVAVSALALAGCSPAGSPSNTTGGDPPSPTGAKYLLPDEPAGAQDVAAVRKSSKTDEAVIVVGRVGGDVDPFVEGAAAFTIVDTSLKPCEDGCPTPWDYCCDLDTLPEKQALIKIVDAQGAPLGEDSRKLLGIKPLSTVVVRGTAKRDDAGNLTVLADGVYVRQ